MDKCEIVERLKNIAEHAVHTVGEKPFVMSLDDGIAVHEAIELLKKPETNCSEIPNNSDTISRQAAIDALLGITAMRNTIPLDSAIFNIKKLPSAQPDIIRCPDCYYNDGTAYCELHFRNVKAKDFCSWAERRE